jgi:hypothetical protein
MRSVLASPRSLVLVAGSLDTAGVEAAASLARAFLAPALLRSSPSASQPVRRSWSTPRSRPGSSTRCWPLAAAALASSWCRPLVDATVMGIRSVERLDRLRALAEACVPAALLQKLAATGAPAP